MDSRQPEQWCTQKALHAMAVPAHGRYNSANNCRVMTELKGSLTRVSKENTACVHKGLCISVQEGQNGGFCKKMDELRGYHVT